MDPADLQLYVRLISGTILGLTVGKLLSGSAKFIQHPNKNRINWLHGLWIAFLFAAVVIFWWQEALSFSRVTWTFPLYAFQIAYCGSFLFIASVLLPDDVDGYESHYAYLIARRHWLYGALILSYLLGIGNEIIKWGWEDLFVSPEYIIINLVVIGLLVSGMVFNGRRLHLSIAALFLLMALATGLLE